MNKRAGRITLYLITAVPIPLAIYFFGHSTDGFYFSGLVAFIALVTETIYTLKGWS